MMDHDFYRKSLHLKIFIFSLVAACQSALHAEAWVLNNPYPISDSLQCVYYNSFTEQPKTLDPAKSYSVNEHIFTAQIYEPLLQYDYLTRPYTLVPLTAAQMPEVHYYNAAGDELMGPDKQGVALTQYTIRIKSGIYYQPHPAFAKDEQGHYLYHQVSTNFLKTHNIHALSDFKQYGTRELVVDDYIYQIKRLANPAVNSPIYSLMGDYLIGFRKFAKILPKASEGFIDLRLFEISGVTKRDDYTFTIDIKGEYPQFIYWLAMVFFAPIPWEVDLFYSQAGMDARNINLGWFPVGTGPFMLSENNPNSRMTLAKNPNYRTVFAPNKGSLADQQAGYLRPAGKAIPFIDKAVYTLEKEAIPRWIKFLQGYYDLSGVVAEGFDQAVRVNTAGALDLTPDMQARGMRLVESADLSIFYLGFNWLDPVVGGNSPRARKLRQAISIAVNYEENIAIFLNGRGRVAQGPIPQGIFGSREGALGINPYIYTWKNVPVRRSIAKARALMQEAGYPNGLDMRTGKPLILYYDVAATGGPDDKDQFDWMRKQFAKLGISLTIRATDYNRFQEKMRNGNAQMYSWGWTADYPDPENFLFLLYGPNGKVLHGGENATNYSNAEFDRLFELMKNRPNDEARLEIIDAMLKIVHRDTPWAGGFNRDNIILSQGWMSPTKPNAISLDTLKYVSIDVPMRNRLRMAWNKPILWPFALFFLTIVLILLPFLWIYHKQQQSIANRDLG